MPLHRLLNSTFRRLVVGASLFAPLGLVGEALADAPSTAEALGRAAAVALVGVLLSPAVAVFTELIDAAAESRLRRHPQLKAQS